ncbi:MAG TPA: sulfatase [Prolixibacteraceae bacterium]|nr:sulfatase [Prolixibacteraceae bacterium]
MKPINLLLFCCSIFILSAFSGCTTQSKEIPQPVKPNILFIFMDDLGWSSLSCLGNPYMDTPHIDKLAENGVLFTDAYSTPQCTPTRASLLTGQHTARNKMWHVVPYYDYPYAKLKEPEYLENLPRKSYTLGEMLKDNGYTTAILGKWHLSTYENDGYYTYLRDSAKQYYGFDYVNPVTDPTEYQSYGDKGVEFLTNEAINFMKENRDSSFFVYLSHHTIHGPVLAPDSLIQKYLELGYPEEGQNSATYLAAINHFDNSVGRLISALKELELDENTMVIFYSDNGGVDKQFEQAPLRHGKGSPYEGGIRVPLIVSWPGKIVPATVNEPVHVVDFYPTLLDYAGGHAQNLVLDGVSFRPLLEGRSVGQRELFWYMPLYDPQWGASPAAVMRDGEYKLVWFFGDYIEKENDFNYIPEGRVELYNLTEDLSETNDLSEELPDKTQKMKDRLYEWIQEMGEDTCELNPNYDKERALYRPPRK